MLCCSVQIISLIQLENIFFGMSEKILLSDISEMVQDRVGVIFRSHGQKFTVMNCYFPSVRKFMTTY